MNSKFYVFTGDGTVDVFDTHEEAEACVMALLSRGLGADIFEEYD